MVTAARTADTSWVVAGQIAVHRCDLWIGARETYPIAPRGAIASIEHLGARA